MPECPEIFCTIPAIILWCGLNTAPNMMGEEFTISHGGGKRRHESLFVLESIEGLLFAHRYLISYQETTDPENASKGVRFQQPLGSDTRPPVSRYKHLGHVHD